MELEFGTAQSQTLYIGWIVANLIRTALTVDNIRSFGGLPDLEYSVELEISTDPHQAEMFIQRWNPPFGDFIGPLGPAPFKLPRLSFGPGTEIDAYLTQARTDIYDACGAGQVSPLEIAFLSG